MMPTEAEILESNVQFQKSWSLYARCAADGEVVEREGIRFANARIPWIFMNVAFLTEPVADAADLERRAREAVEYFAPEGNPWFLTASDRWLGRDGLEVLSGIGLKPLMSLEGMVAPELAPPARPLPHVDVRRIEDEDSRFSLSDLNAIAYGAPLEYGRAAVGTERLWSEPLNGYVAYVDDEAAASAFAVPIDDVLYVGWVATAHEHRRRGLAELVIRRSLDDASAATGLTRTVLHATPDGHPVYERMGYRDVATFPILTLG